MDKLGVGCLHFSEVNATGFEVEGLGLTTVKKTFVVGGFDLMRGNTTGLVVGGLDQPGVSTTRFEEGRLNLTGAGTRGLDGTRFDTVGLGTATRTEADVGGVAEVADTRVVEVLCFEHAPHGWVCATEDSAVGR